VRAVSLFQQRRWRRLDYQQCVRNSRRTPVISCGQPALYVGLYTDPRGDSLTYTWQLSLTSLQSICKLSTGLTGVKASTTALFDYVSAGRSTHCAFYHWRPNLSSDCCIGLEQFVGVGPVVFVIASFPQQTENRTFCPVLQSWLTTSHCTDYYYVTSLFKLIVTCPCRLRT